LSNPTSMISWGVLILSLFIPVAFLYAAALNEFPLLSPFARKHVFFLKIAGSVLAVATAGYTGVLIAVVNGVPFWNTAIMPVLFLASAISTGLAIAMIGAAAVDSRTIRNLSNFAMGHIVFLSIEAFVLMMFLFMSLTRSSEAAASAGMLISGGLSPYFWGLVVVLGILVPYGFSFLEYFRYGHAPKVLVIAADVFVLIGGVSLRALIIFSGLPPKVI
jgi:polysulfide reductase chain C